MIISCKPEILKNSKWHIKEGNISFWRDSWLDDGRLCDSLPIMNFPNIRAKDLILENGWDIELLQNLLGVEQAEVVFCTLGRSREGGNVLVWKGNSDESFSTKSALDIIRVKSTKLQWTQWVWHSSLPKKISVMAWKAFNHALSVDDRIIMFGIPLASKCDCYVHGAHEHQDHVLAMGDFAKEIWKKASVLVVIPFVPGRGWQALVAVWFQKTKKSSQMGQLMGLIPLIIIWRIWLH